MAVAQGLHQQAVSKLQVALIIGDIPPHVFLHIRVLMVVDPDAVVTGTCSQILYDTGFARARRSLQKDKG